MSRRALAGLWAILPMLVTLLGLGMLPAPERVPTHWTGDLPDGWASGTAFGSTVLTLVALAAITAALVAVLRRAVPDSWSRWAVTAAAAVGWGAALAYVVTVWRARIDGPEGVSSGWDLLVVLAAVVGGLVAYLLHGVRVPDPGVVLERIPERARVVPVTRGVAPSWSTAVRSRTLQVVGLGVLVVFLVVGLGIILARQGVWTALLLLVVGGGTAALALVWSSIIVHVDAEGLQVRSALVPVTLARVAAQEVLGVEVLDLNPMAWGGVGLRALPGRTAYIVDGGPGIVVWRRDGRRLALQITEGESCARDGARALLTAAGQRAGSAPTS